MSKTSTLGTSRDTTGREPANPLGTTEPTIAPPFDSNYSLVSIGYPIGVQTYFGGLTFKYDDPNTLLIAGAAGSQVGRIYQIAVNRDANGHIVGFNGIATLYPGAGSTIGQFNDAGLAFGPANVLFVTRYFANHLGQLEQSKVGSLTSDKVIDLAPLGVTGSGGSIGFVPPGFPGAGSMKLISWGGSGWYHCEFAPDANGTFNITSASLRATISSGPEGIAFVPPDSPVFSPNSVLIVEYGYSKVVTAQLDTNGDPIMAQSQDFIRNIPQAFGACIDPVTGDFLFDTWGGSNEVIRVTGFATPTPAPSCTPGPWVSRADYPFEADSAALATDGTYAYAFGGSSSNGGGQHAEANRYDPATNSWTPLASMSGQDFYLHGEYGGNGKIYVIGGGFYQRANRIYDIDTNSWSTGTQVPIGIWSYGHAYANGKIYVIGGVTANVPSSAVYAYDVASDTWSAPLAPLPQAEFYTACGAINNKIYVAGGNDGDNVRNNLYIYDIATNSWTAGRPMPAGVESPGGAVVNGKLWVIGGRDRFATFLHNTQIYDPVTNSWSYGPLLITSRSFADAVTLNVVGGQMPMIVGGYTSGIGSLSDVEANLIGCVESSPTPTPTATPTGTATATATPASTATATPTATATATPTATATATATATPTATGTATATPTPTATSTATATPTPEITTNPATNVASVSATFNGSVNPRGSTTTVYFQWGTTTSYGHTTPVQTQTGNTSRPVTANISGLSASHLYHFRIVATNGGGTSFGADRTFTTMSAPPAVTSNPATNVASFSATLNGSVNPRGSSTTVYFQWGTTTSYGHSTPVQTQTGNTYRNIAANISGLAKHTAYHFRIVATNGGGTRFGPDRTFTSLSASGPPVVTTNPATNVSTLSARLNGSLDPHGLTTTVYFKWGTTTSYGHTTPVQTQTGNTYRNITANISGLTGDHTYHFRIVGINAGGTRHGADRTFTTH